MRKLYSTCLAGTSLELPKAEGKDKDFHFQSIVKWIHVRAISTCLASKKHFASVIVFVMLFTSCEEVLEVYIGFPLQPENVNSVYVPGYNVFGMCKAGTTLDQYNQHFEVHFIPHIFDTISDISYGDASITIQKNSEDYTIHHLGDGIYMNQTIMFNPGDEWSYTCVADTFKITSQTRIPNMPNVNLSGILLYNNILQFMIEEDNTAFLYDIAYVDQFGYATKRIVPVYDGDTFVEIEIDYNESSALNNLYVIAYDENYETYISTSNIFFKPNAFRPRFTTVDGGYGSFGSLCSLELNLKELVSK